VVPQTRSDTVAPGWQNRVAPVRDDTLAVSGGRWRRVPLVQWRPRYQVAWLRRDLVAGAVVAALAIPQALGYASIAGAPVEVGRYAGTAALVA